MDEKLRVQPDDVLEYRCPQYGTVWQWRVFSVCHGAWRQESLIELQPVMARPGFAHDKEMTTVWVPEPMTRNLTIFRPKPVEEPNT